MTFVRKSASTLPLEDAVFAVARAAAKDRQENGDLVVNATVGSLFDEDGSFVAFDSVFDHYDGIDHTTKGSYAAAFLGNPGFRDAVWNWTTQTADIALAHSVVATPGGSGAVATSFVTFLDEGETVILPDIAWGSYQLMASHNNLKVRNYEMFEGDHFNLRSVKEAIDEVLNTQDRIVLVVNDPCHNPTGYSMTMEEWNGLIAILNEAGEKAAVILINDIAYIDYSYRGNRAREYMSLFNGFSDNVLAVTAFSCSKALTSYGLRCGAAILMSQKQESVQEAETVFEKAARACWSNVPNAAMDNFAWVVTDNREAYLTEKQHYVDLLKERSEIFVKEAEECGLPIYPYKEGFFVTIKEADRKKAVAEHEALMENHIYTVLVNKGIRVAVCSLPVRKAKGLAKRIKDIMDSANGKGA
ncbi:MAG: aminotransferase class I/II-fold pyridoxal phosphate-dependent enzyme [Solobacterium sp.]|nr:aminotransferase class I/II-fold pyridoxal phosphate-dependent enzyme [Solobacterium sp.]